MILIKNIFILWGRKRFFLPFTYFPTNLVYPITLRVKGIKTRKKAFFKFLFPVIPMRAIRYSCPTQLAPTYILPSKNRTLLGKFQPDSLKTDRLVCIDMPWLTRLVMLIKNIYTLWCRKRLLHCVAKFWLKS